MPYRLASPLLTLPLLPLLLVWPTLAGCGSTPEPRAPAVAAPTQPFFADPPRWRPIFQGIEYAELANDKPRDMVVQAMRIDTSTPGLELVTTPANGDRPLETDGQTTRAFLEEHDLSVAVNTHFFDPCCNRVPGEAKDLIGLSIAQGSMVSPPTDPGQPDAITFAQDLTPEVLRSLDEQSSVVITVPRHAIAGRMVLVRGQLDVGQDAFSTARHPRTLVGLSDNLRFIYLVTIDGRQPGFSTGASLAESSAIMHHLGAWHAINVDGGGSTTMVVQDPDGASQLVNSPSGGAERVVGSNLGFRALPLQPRVPSDS